jgi:hypothetical protein
VCARENSSSRSSANVGSRRQQGASYIPAKRSDSLHRVRDHSRKDLASFALWLAAVIFDTPNGLSERRRSRRIGG